MQLTTRTKFNRILYSLIREYADVSGEDPQIVKDKVKKYLIEKSFIKQSLSEADLKGLAVGCNLVEIMIKNNSK